jgi:methylthioribose-1-phosphate isomerase
MAEAVERIATVRPTAGELAAGANGAWAAARPLPPAQREAALWQHANAYLQRRIAEDEALATYGLTVLPERCQVLTHCNTGALATGGIGTALGVIRKAWESGRLTRCFATETRPLLQGARLTAWELKQAGIPASLLPDTAAASLIASGQVQAVITGADRIAANGESANKIGTYGLAAVAARHRVPFFIAAPTSTFDLAASSAADIPIEFRDAREVGGFGEVRWAPDGLDAYNPAFDVTPGDLIAGIITERGVARPPYAESLQRLARTL